MIWRIWSIFGVIFVGGAWLLAIPFSPAPQMKTGTVIETYRAMGILPPPGGVKVVEAGHGVFEVPADDAKFIKAARAKITASMGDMSGMKMEGQMPAGMKMEGQTETPKTEMPAGMKMEGQTETAKAEMPAGMKMGGQTEVAKTEMPAGMKMGGQAEAAKGQMPGMKQDGMEMAAATEEHDEKEETAGHGGGGVDVGISILALGPAAEVAKAARGLKITREVKLEMREWGFSLPSLMVKPGEVIRFKVKNTGNLPHEFMLMDQAGMQGVNYRLERADWNLMEHEAITEVQVVMPGDEFEMVIQVHKAGVWMYMCMFPFHMQLGMMGMMMTEGMQMGDMPGMQM